MCAQEQLQILCKLENNYYMEINELMVVIE